MDAKAVVAVSGVIVMLVQILKSTKLSGEWALLVCALLSVVGVGMWGYSTGSYERHQLWDYFAGWVAVFSSAAGVFNIVNSAPAAVTTVTGAGTRLVQAIKGTGDGN